MSTTYAGQYLPGMNHVCYQLPIYSSSNQWFSVRLHINNQQLMSTIMLQGGNNYLNLNSLWMAGQYKANYEFGLTCVNSYSCDFEDCRNNYQGSKNIYAMYLPSVCREIANMWSEKSVFVHYWMEINRFKLYFYTLSC